MVDGLAGRDRTIVQKVKENGKVVRVITSRKLEDYLLGEVPRQVAALRLKRAQTPDAIVETVLPAYLSRLAPGGIRPTAKPRPHRGVAPPLPPDDEAPPSRTASRIASLLIHADLDVLPPMGYESDDLAELPPVLKNDAEIVRSAVGRVQFESECGFTIIGSDVRVLESPGAHCDVGPAGSKTCHIQVSSLDRGRAERPSSVVIEFENGRGCVLAALPGYVGTAIVDRAELANVTYEPSQNSWRWDMYRGRVDQLETLRGLVASATRHGVFRIQGDHAGEIAERIRVLKAIDPTLGIYAAYAYNDAGMFDRVRSVASFMRDDLNGALFDVAMLERRPGSEMQLLEAPEVTPFCPILSQGWALLAAKRVRLPREVREAGQYRAPSLWTMFEETGLALVRSAVQSGDAR